MWVKKKKKKSWLHYFFIAGGNWAWNKGKNQFVSHFQVSNGENNDHHLFSSVQFSRLVVSDSLRPHEPQHARPPCPPPTPVVYPNPCPLSRWCHPINSSSVIPFSSCPQSFPASGSFKWISSSHQVARVLEFQLQHQSFQSTPRTDLPFVQY